MTPGADTSTPALTGGEKARLQAAQSDLIAMGGGLLDGTATPSDVEGALNRLQCLNIDIRTLLNAAHIPPDAGPNELRIAAILRRIPDGWGRELSVATGWHDLVVDTDARLSDLDADYVVHQIKEKYGALRYYCAPSSEDPGPELLEAFDAIVDEAERTSEVTCEQCGEAGTRHQNQREWIKALCARCAPALGYAPAPR